MLAKLTQALRIFLPTSSSDEACVRRPYGTPLPKTARSNAWEALSVIDYCEREQQHGRQPLFA